MSPAVSVHFLQSQSDERLLALARRGHERAFEALVRRHRKQLVGYCRRLLLPEGRAEDAVQQALLQAWVALERGDEIKDARAWLFRIAHNTALNSLRGSRYDYAQLSESLVGAQAPDSDLDRRIAIREALAGLAALPALQREALLRTAVEGRRHEEVAAAMGLSDGALRGLVYRARATMRSAVTAVTPPSLVAWVASAGAHTGSAARQIPELTAGGGSAGLAALLLKGGTVAVTAGALVVGATAVREHRAAPPRINLNAHSLHRAAGTGSGADAASQATTAELIAVRRGASHRGGQSPDQGFGSPRHGAGRRLGSAFGEDRRGLLGGGHDDNGSGTQVDLKHLDAAQPTGSDHGGSDSTSGSGSHDASGSTSPLAPEGGGSGTSSPGGSSGSGSDLPSSGTGSASELPGSTSSTDDATIHNSVPTTGSSGSTSSTGSPDH